MGKYGFDINTGEPIDEYKDRLVYIGGGSYKRASDITQEDLDRRAMWNDSIDTELLNFKLGLEES